MGDNFYR